MLTNKNDGIVEKAMAEEIWLTYFNDYLLENGVISQTEHDKMVPKIVARNATNGKSKHRN